KRLRHDSRLPLLFSNERVRRDVESPESSIGRVTVDAGAGTPADGLRTRIDAKRGRTGAWTPLVDRTVLVVQQQWHPRNKILGGTERHSDRCADAHGLQDKLRTNDAAGGFLQPEAASSRGLVARANHPR